MLPHPASYMAWESKLRTLCLHSRHFAIETSPQPRHSLFHLTVRMWLLEVKLFSYFTYLSDTHSSSLTWLETREESEVAGAGGTESSQSEETSQWEAREAVRARHWEELKGWSGHEGWPTVWKFISRLQASLRSENTLEHALGRSSFPQHQGLEGENGFSCYWSCRQRVVYRIVKKHSSVRTASVNVLPLVP